jgi:hypothetical protein
MNLFGLELPPALPPLSLLLLSLTMQPYVKLQVTCGGAKDWLKPVSTYMFIPGNARIGGVKY